MAVSPSTPANPVYVQPDLEAFVWEQLGILHGITSWSAGALTDHPAWQSRHNIQVDSRSTSKKRARDRAYDAHYLMLGLPSVAWADGVITFVQPTSGPFWMPDDDGAPRYTATYEVRAHPRTPVAPVVEPNRRRSA